MEKNLNYKEALLELYLASIRADEEDIFEGVPIPESQGQILGSFREFKHQGQLVLYMIGAKQKDGSYLCYKASLFTDFAVSTDLIVPGLGGDYLVDPFNKFILSEKEVTAGVELFCLSLLEFLDFEIALEEMPAEPEDVFRDIDLDSPAARFRIQEYELSLEFRSRTSPDQLWIPQLVFDFPELEQRQNAYAAKGQDLMDAFKMLKQEDDAKKFYTPTHTLAVTADGKLVLIPNEEYLDKVCNIYCGAFKVFSGVPKKMFYVGKRLPYPLAEIQEILNIRIEPI
ncbi:MAG: hypothetical protein WBI94_06085 [Candidatus Cloacimonadaceae bacterium]|jgi:hypothetical protein